MPQPPTYTRQFDFSDFSASNPLDQQPGGSLDAEFDAIKTTTDAVRGNLAKIQRDDGALANDSVGVDQLKPEVAFGLNAVSEWASSTDYEANAGVWANAKLYRCLEAHTSGTFATDLADGKWSLLLDVGTYTDVAVTAAADATDSAAAAALSEGNAALSASTAATQAGIATTQAGIATTQAGNAAASAAAAAGYVVPSQTGNAGKFLSTDGSATQWASLAGSVVSQSGVVYIASGASTTISGRSVLAAYAQIAGTTLNLDYNTRASYVEQDSTNGTDAGGGTFTLHATAGGAADSSTSLLLHADGVNGSTEVIDSRGITPFGTYCGYFDGSAKPQIPQSYKTAFGSAQDFTIEFWLRPASLASAFYAFDMRTSNTDTSSIRPILMVNTNGSVDYSVAGTTRFSAASGTIVANTWQHVALCRSAGTTRLFVGGAVVGSFTDTLTYVDAPIYVGNATTGTSAPLTGWMDEFRVSAIARYSAGFTVPSAAFTRDANTVYLLHFEDGHGAQVLKDDSRSGHSDLYLNGVSLSTAQAKFGSSSLRLPGGNNYLQTQGSKYHADYAVGSDDFTIDFWVRLDAVGTTQIIFSGNSWNPTIKADLTTIKVYLSSNNSSWDIANGTAIGSIAANTWTHVALTRSGTSVYGFVGGTLGATIAVSTTNIFPSTGYFSFGRSGGTEYLTGYIDEFRFKRGTAAWTTTFTPPSSVYSTDDRTVLLLHFEGANGAKVTVDSSENSYGTDAFGDTTIPSLAFANSAALSSAQTRGGHSTSLALNGTNQYASLQYATPGVGHPLYFAAGEQFCIEAWFYASTLTGAPVIVHGCGVSQGTSTDFYLQANGTTSAVFTTTALGVGSAIASGPACAVGWNHIAVVREGRGWVIYTNGVAGSASSVGTALSYASEAYNLFLGNWRGSGTGNGNYLSGAIDAVRITHGKPRYTSNFTPATLTQDDDTALMWEFNGSVGQKWVKELSKNSALLVGTGVRTVSDGRWMLPVFQSVNTSSVSTAQSKFGGASLLVNGTSSNYWSTPHTADVVPSGDFTVDMWVRPGSYAGDRPIAHKWNGTNLTWEASLVITTGKAKFSYVDTAGSTITLTTTGALTLDVWTHLAFVRTSGVLKCYINGTVDATTATATNGIRQTDTTGALFIGVNAAASSQFNGYIDELRISTTARWTTNFTAPTTPYGQTYATGPYWVATKPGASSLDLSAWSSINSVTPTITTPVSTTLLFLISTDGYGTALKRWNGSAWVATAYSMTWNGTTLTTTATAAQLNAVANTAAELTTGLLALDVSAITSLNVVAVLATGSTSYTPILDALTIGLSEYTQLRPVTDYTVSRKKASGAQTITVTRAAAGNANHVFDYIP